MVYPRTSFPTRSCSTICLTQSSVYLILDKIRPSPLGKRKSFFPSFFLRFKETSLLLCLSLSNCPALLSYEHMALQKWYFPEMQRFFTLMWWFGICGIHHSAGRLSRVTLVHYNFGVKIHHVLRHLPPVCSDTINSKVCTVFFTLVVAHPHVSLSWHVLWPVDRFNYTEFFFYLIMASKPEWRRLFNFYQHVIHNTWLNLYRHLMAVPSAVRNLSDICCQAVIMLAKSWLNLVQLKELISPKHITLVGCDSLFYTVA